MNQANTISDHRNEISDMREREEIPATLGQALALHQAGRLTEAEPLYRRVLELHPTHFDSLHLLGVLHYQQGRHDHAVRQIGAALLVNPNAAAAHNNFGAALTELKRFEEAAASYGRAITLNPDYAEAYYNRGNALKELNRHEDAVRDYDHAIALKPGFADAFNNRASALKALRRFEEAVAGYDQAIALRQNSANFFFNRGNLLKDLKRCGEAIRDYDQAIVLKPNYAEAFNNRGIAFKFLGRLEEALASYDQAIALNTDYADALKNHADVLFELGRLDESRASWQRAVACYDRLIVIRPDDAELLRNRGIILTQQGRPDEALASFNKALALKPDLDLNIYARMASIYDSRGEISKALEAWRHAEPLDDPMISGLACQSILKLPGATYQDIAALQQRWADRFAQPVASKNKFFFRPYDGHRKIRLGYHCCFMGGDTIRYGARSAIAAHDRSRFEVFAYVGGSNTDMPDDIGAAFDEIRISADLTDNDFVDLVRQDEIDILVELSGFSVGHRFVAMASRCAPVQISHLNHHGTSCIPAVDYFFSDEWSTPTGSDADRTFTERIYRLPCLLFFDYDGYEHPPVSDPPCLHRGRTTFGCFGGGAKINPELIALWAELLRRVPEATLYLRNAQLSAPDDRRYMIDAFSRQGIGVERLRIEGGTDRYTLMQCYADVDVSLDTWPYCGGNTVGESLWQGVPVVTLNGTRVSSRYGASLLMMAGCPDLIANSNEEYLTIATNLAADTARLKRLRYGLRSMCKEFGLGDATRFARDLERAYDVMLKNSCAAQTPLR
jgi:predicted O-linked N-acetylglucosamine transferase (SPINDLY family)